MSETVIKVENVDKKFSKNLKHMMLYGMQDITRNVLGMEAITDRLREGEFKAVDNVSFELKRGETLGIIGPNGSGKTTLLKMLNGIFMPDKGEIKVKGRVGALIQVGAGFHPMLTGRENIYVNGAILGMGKKEIDRKFDSIVDFADIGDFLDAPVKHYSSGMYVRLGFAIAVHCQPDILLIDEILAVGDREFNIKCYQKMHQIRKSGVSIVLVSHNEYVIREQTLNCLYLKDGRVRFQGSSEEGISLYIKEGLQERGNRDMVGRSLAAKKGLKEKVELLSVKFFDKDFNEISFIESGGEFNIMLECVIREKISNPIFGVNFYADNGFMYCANSDYENVNFKDLPPGKVRVKINIPRFHVPADNYLCSAIVAEGDVNNLLDWHNMVYRFVVGRAKNARGSVKLPTKWEAEIQ